MYKVITTGHFYKFFKKLPDNKRYVIEKRIRKINENSHLGDYKQIDKDLYEFRIFSCGGIRIYFTIKDNIIIILLYGGFKESKEQQQKDIKEAKKELENINNYK